MPPLRFDLSLLKRAERWIFALVGLTVLLTLVATFLTTKQSLMDHLYNFPYLAVWWLVAATAFESLIRFWRYHTAARALGLRVPFWRMMYYYTVGYALIPTPGKVGTAIRLWLLKVNHNLPYTRTAPLLAMDLVSDSIALCALGALGLAILENPTLQSLGWLVGLALGVGLVATLVAPQLLMGLVGHLYVLGGRRKPRLFARLRQLIRHTSRVLGWRVLAVTSAQSFIGWAAVGLAIGHLLTALGTPMGMAEGSVTISLATMGGFLTMMPAGVGGAEAAMGFLLSSFGAPLATVVLAVAVIRLVVLWLTVLIGLALLPFALRSGTKT
ncbi:MAG: flippase-like domain-containing protein [Alphaproteobacteria bacterium]|jgi:uncharacterized membrane protein YbhN (UPF0104 family)|nr:flippase-like domain-containing protein [Alphaproteobacteria bacterium]